MRPIMIGPPPFLRLVRRYHLQDREALPLHAVAKFLDAILKIPASLPSAEILGAP